MCFVFNHLVRQGGFDQQAQVVSPAATPETLPEHASLGRVGAKMDAESSQAKIGGVTAAFLSDPPNVGISRKDSMFLSWPSLGWKSGDIESPPRDGIQSFEYCFEQLAYSNSLI